MLPSPFPSLTWAFEHDLVFSQSLLFSSAALSLVKAFTAISFTPGCGILTLVKAAAAKLLSYSASSF
jgi:hypothetical protein